MLSPLSSPSLMSEIARQIRDPRAARGWSQHEVAQHEVAQHAGVSSTTVARVEAGDDVNTSKLVRIAAALGLVLRIARPEVPWELPQGGEQRYAGFPDSGRGWWR